MVKLSTPLTAAWLTAQERALEDRQAGRRPERVGSNTYRIPSSKGDGSAYIVTIRNAGALLADCTCEHGRNGGKGHCRHEASALMAELERVSRKPVITAEQPAPSPRPALTRVSPEAFAARFAAA